MKYGKYLVSEGSHTADAFNAHRKAMDGISAGASVIYKKYVGDDVETKVITNEVNKLFKQYKPDMDAKDIEKLRTVWISTIMGYLRNS